MQRTVLVTGGNSGIGLEAVRAMAALGDRVVLASRDASRGAAARADVLHTAPDADVELLALDLADLSAVERAAGEALERHPRLDVLVNNAGVMATPLRRTADGFELQLGTNHLGHFALTGRLLPALLAAPAPRVVTVSSGAHRIGGIDFSNLDGSRGYSRWRAYGQSKLANLLFTAELQRRVVAAGLPLRSVAAHPGYAATNLQARGPQMSGSRLGEALAALGNRLLAQPAVAGALPTVHAATAAHVRGGDYFGPDGPFEARGRPARADRSAAARDEATARRLWEVSQDLTGVRYDALGAA